MAETKTKRNLPRQCRREDTATPPSTPTKKKTNEARDWKVTKKTSEGHEEDAAKLFREEEEGLEGHEEAGITG